MLTEPSGEDRPRGGEGKRRVDALPPRHSEEAMEDSAACALIMRATIEAMLEESLACVQHTPRAWRPYWMAFQWSCVTGEWGGALAMLEQCARLNDNIRLYLDHYRGCLMAERHRARVFLCESPDAAVKPVYLPRTRPWVKSAVHQLQLANLGQPGAAPRVRTRLMPDLTGGTSNLGSFSWLCDGDARLGPISELFVDGRYVWLPLENVAEMRFTPVNYMLDRVWRPVDILLWSGKKHAGFLPARYVGSQFAGDELKLGYDTLWVQVGTPQQAGLGERNLKSACGYWPLSQLKHIRFNPCDRGQR